MASNSGNQLIAWLHEVIARVWVAVNLVAIRYRWNCGCAAKPCSWRYATNSKIVVTLTGSASQWKVQADRHLRPGVGQGGLQHTMHLEQKPFSVGQVSVDLLLPSNLRRMTIGHDHSLKRCPCILDCWSSRHFRQNLLQFLGILKMYRRRWWWHAQNSWLARVTCRLRKSSTCRLLHFPFRRHPMTCNVISLLVQSLLVSSYRSTAVALSYRFGI